MTLVKRLVKGSPVSAAEYDAVVDQVETNKDSIEVLNGQFKDSEVTLSFANLAAATSYWNTQDGLSNTPTDGVLIYIEDVKEDYKWLASDANKAVATGRNFVETSDGSDTLENSTKYFDGAKIFTKVQSEITDTIEQNNIYYRLGKNRFNPNDPDIITGEFIRTVDSNGQNGTISITGKVPIKEGETLNVNFNTGNLRCGLYDKNNVKIFTSNLGATSISYQSEANYAKFSYYNDDISNFMIYPSTEDSTYEAYKEISALELKNLISSLSQIISTEETNRINADATLQNNIDAEITARQNADTTLQANIDTEITARQNAIANVQALVDAILNASDADKDSFAEIVALINSVDLENDNALASAILTLQQNIDKKANLEVGKNLFNKDATEITLVSGDSATTDNYGDVIIKDAAATGFNLGTWGIAYNQYNLSVSHKIPLSETNNKAKSNQNVSTSTQVIYFDVNGVAIGTATQTVQATWFTNVDYCRFVFPSANKATLQIEYGEVSTAYEAYALKIKETDLPTPTGAVASGNKNSVSGENIFTYINAQGFAVPSDLNNKADLEIQTINLFNKDATKVPAVDNESPYDSDVFADDAIIEHGWSTGYNFGTFKIIYQVGSSLSPKIFLTETGEKNTITTNVPSNVYQKIFYFNALGQIINIAANVTSATWIADTSYVRVMFQPTFTDSLMINYGAELQTYSDYDGNLYLKKSQIPPVLVQKTELQTEIENKIISVFGSIPELCLPDKLFFLKDELGIIYLKGIVNNQFGKTDYTLKVNDATVTKLHKEEDVIIVNSTSTANVTNTFTLQHLNSILDSKDVSIEVVEAPATAKVLEVWNSGDSLSDLGNYQPEIKRLLALNNITANFRGLMNVGTDDTVYADPLSGGDLGFIAEKGTDAMVVDVSGITVRPVTGYPGTQYEDTNGNSWVVRGYQLTESGGTYSGKLKLGIFQVDPNYDTGGSSGTTPTGGFPTNSTLTKTNGLAGDAVINYTTVDVVNFNPYWNPNTDELDFEWYRTYWNYAVPNLFLLQFSFNDLSGVEFAEIDGTKITTAISRAKIVIDKFLSQFPNAKVVFGTDPYGAELPLFNGTVLTSKRYSTLNLFKALCKTFENATYDGKVYLVPTHAQFNHKFGYGAIVEETHNFGHFSYTTEKLANGFDGVHPNNSTEGWKEEAKAYVPICVKIANNL